MSNHVLRLLAYYFITYDSLGAERRKKLSERKENNFIFSLSFTPFCYLVSLFCPLFQSIFRRGGRASEIGRESLERAARGLPKTEAISASQRTNGCLVQQGYQFQKFDSLIKYVCLHILTFLEKFGILFT